MRDSGRAPQDQAAGLRRLFGARAPRWLPVLMPAGNEGRQGAWLARLARGFATQGDRTLLVDAARAQAAASLGMRLRFDLQHALDGDCLPQAACVEASEGLFILPAARAIEALDGAALCASDRIRRFEAGVRALARGFDCVIVALPVRRTALAAMAALAGPEGCDDVLLATGGGAGQPPRCFEAMSAAMGAADIDTFHLLFLDMDAASAGRLFPRLAAVAARELGARIADGGRVADPEATLRLVRALRCRPAGGRAHVPVGRLSEVAEIRS